MSAAQRWALVTCGALCAAFAGGSQPQLAQVGYAASFQGKQAILGLRTGDPIDFAAPGWQDVDTEFSISVWSRGELGGQYSKIPSSSYVLKFATAGNNAVCDLSTDGIGLDWVSTGDYFDDVPGDLRGMQKWHHRVYVVHRNGTVVLYRDGRRAQTNSLTRPFSLRQPGLTMYVGALLYTGAPIKGPLVWNPRGQLHGELDELMLFSRALGQDEARALFMRPADPQAPISGVVLHYTFDVGGCSADDASLLGDSCQVTGDGVVKNRGAAGPNYDLAVGHLNNRRGFGLMYGEISGAPGRFTFDRTGTAPSSVPWGGLDAGSLGSAPWPLRADLPLVFRVEAGGSVRVPLLELFGAAALAPLTLGDARALLSANATLVRGSDGAALDAGASLVAEPFFDLIAPAGGLAYPVSLALLDGASNRTAQLVHVWPLLTPSPSALITQQSNALVLECVQGSVNVSLALSGALVSPTGEEFHFRLVSEPRLGELVILNTSIGDGSVSSSFGQYTPHAGALGLDKFRVAAARADAGVAVVEFDVHVRVLLDDRRPSNVSDLAVAVAEDAASGLEIELPGTDDLERFGLTFAVSRLPSLGKLFTEERPGGRRRAIDAPFNRFDVGTVISQYASSVLRVSSFSPAQRHSGYLVANQHPLTMLGAPNCKKEGLGQSFCFGNTTVVGTLVNVGLVVQRKEGNHTMWFSARVSAARKRGDLVNIDVDLLDMFDWLPDPSSPNDTNSSAMTYQRCLPGPENDECSGAYLAEVRAALACVGAACPSIPFSPGNNTELGLRELVASCDFDLDEKCLVMNVMDSWSTFARGFQKELLVADRSTSMRYGPQFAWGPLNMSATYEDGPPTKAPFTEFVELGFDTAVFPVSVMVGTQRGGGGIVNVLARDASTGRWQSLYQGAPQVQKNLDTNGRRFYFVFDSPLCRAPFKTDALRLELDTSAQTGIADWNHIDYVELVGSPGLQSAVLAGGARRVWYVPDADQSGADSFSFLATDCLGSAERESAPATVSVAVRAEPDAPIPSFEPAEVVLRCGIDERADFVVSVVDLDGDESAPHIVLENAPALGELAIAPFKSAPATPLVLPVATARHWRAGVSYSVDCAALTGSSELNLTFSISSASSPRAGASRLQVIGRVLKQDPARISPAVRAICLALFSLSWAASWLCLAWTARNRGRQVVKVAQLPFLVLVVVGTLVSSSAIALVLVEDDGTAKSTARASLACNTVVWVYCVGFQLTFSALYVKMLRVLRLSDLGFIFKLAIGPKETKERAQRQVSAKSMVKHIAMFMAVDVLLCGVLSLGEPLRYERHVEYSDPVTGYPMLSSGACRATPAQGAVFFLIAVYHATVLGLLAVLCHRSRNVPALLSEGRFIRLAVWSSLQLLIVCTPVLFLTSKGDADTVAFVRSVSVFLDATSCLLLIFLPKFFMRGFASKVNVAERLTNGGNGGSNSTETTVLY